MFSWENYPNIVSRLLVIADGADELYNGLANLDLSQSKITGLDIVINGKTNVVLENVLPEAMKDVITGLSITSCNGCKITLGNHALRNCIRVARLKLDGGDQHLYGGFTPITHDVLEPLDFLDTLIFAGHIDLESSTIQPVAEQLEELQLRGPVSRGIAIDLPDSVINGCLARTLVVGNGYLLNVKAVNEAMPRLRTILAECDIAGPMPLPRGATAKCGLCMDTIITLPKRRTRRAGATSP